MASTDGTPTLRAELSPRKTPPEWHTADGFPLPGSGKIQKFVIRESWEKGADADHEF